MSFRNAPQAMNPASRNFLDYTYFDQNTIATTNTTSSFFTNTAGKTKQQSNFPQNGRLASGNKFAIRKIRVHVRPILVATPLTERDVDEVLRGYMRVTFNGTTMWEGHPWDCAAGAGIWVNDGTAAAIHAIQNGFPSVLNTRWLDPVLGLTDEQLAVEFEYNPAITLANSAVVTVILDGVLNRKTG